MIASEFENVLGLLRVSGGSLVALNESVLEAQNASMLQKMQAVSKTIDSAFKHVENLQNNQSAILALMFRINGRIEYLAQRAGLDLDAVEGL